MSKPFLTPEKPFYSSSAKAALSNTHLALQHAHDSLKPYIQAILAFGSGKEFQALPSRRRRQSFLQSADTGGPFSITLTSLYVGISAVFSDSHTAVVAIAIHDSVYLHDFSVKTLELQGLSNNGEDIIADFIIKELEAYEHKNLSKFIGAGVPYDLMGMSPKLCSRLWSELDIVPISMRPDQEGLDMSKKDQTYWNVKVVDEQADSMARKAIMFFGPNQAPLLQVGFRGVVQIDAGFHTHIFTSENYQQSCGDPTWKAMMKFVTELKSKGTKIAFFSSTPQGGGVALMRHALVRFARVIGVDLTWYVPKPKPGVFRITKTVHNVLQGVAEPDVWITAEEKKTLTDWISDNAERYWFSTGGPLRPPSEGGADVVVIDDPQMPGLIPLIKALTPDRPVLYRSHIQIRSDLADKAGTPQADIWAFLWENIQHADMFISHPMPSFVPKNVPRSKVAYLPATTDWLDGLNKNLNEWDRGYYGSLYNNQCHAMRITQLDYPSKKYFIQVARFDPSKGIPDVLKSYQEFRRRIKKQGDDSNAPQLLIVGNGSIDDPDGTMIYDQTMHHIETHCPSLLSSISIMRLEPNDQLLNTLISNAHIVMQLSTREGFEVKVSEALHKGIPVIASNVGGIPLQVQHEKNGFLVEPGDWNAVADKLMSLWTDEKLYENMSKYAAGSVSDEVGTVGNALSWFYLAAVWARGEGLKPNGRWVNDLARADAAVEYKDGENRLPRSSTAV